MIPYPPVFVVVILGETVRRRSGNKTETLSASSFPDAVFVDEVRFAGVEVRTAVIGV
jgi:hypothetical protein